MPIAYPFSTLGKLNGLPGCVPKVDISNFDHWTTASGYNKDSEGAVTQEQIDHSLQKIGRLYWNLHKVNVDTSYGTSAISEQFVTGIADGMSSDAIQPRERVCGGSLSTFSTDNVDGRASGQIDLLQPSGMVRMYNGATTEANFIGYGFGLIDYNYVINGTIMTAANNDLFVDNVFVALGGYGSGENNSSAPARAFEYVIVDGLHFLFFGLADSSGSLELEVVNPSTLTASILGIQMKAQVTGIEFWSY